MINRLNTETESSKWPKPKKMFKIRCECFKQISNKLIVCIVKEIKISLYLSHCLCVYVSVYACAWKDSKNRNDIPAKVLRESRFCWHTAIISR